MKIQDTYQLAYRWHRLTGTNLRDFVDIWEDGEVLPNIAKLEEWLRPAEDESIEEALRRQYGTPACNIILQFFL